jgi:hypothetical protein
MNTWPISAVLRGERWFVGIPPRLGSSAGARDVAAPTLEQRGGDDWLREILTCLLPRERPWAWWLRNDVLRQTQLETARAPAHLTATDLTAPMRRNRWLRQMSLLLIPAQHTPAQDCTLDWAGMDTEHIPEHVWTLPDAPDAGWDLDRIATWCSESQGWRSAAQAAAQPAERVLTLFDGYTYCTLSREAGDRARQVLTALAARWGLELIAGPGADAWVDGVEEG